MSRDALIIGINRYKNSSGLRSLKAPAWDANAIAQVLKSYSDFNNIKLFPEALNPDTDKPEVGDTGIVSVTELKAAIANLFLPKTKKPPEAALLYFSGHGLRDDLGLEGFLAASDVDVARSAFGISLDWLRKLMEKSPVKQQIIWLDCCHAGEAIDFETINIGDRGEGCDRCIIAASRDFEAAIEGRQHGEFTKALLHHLNPNNAPTGRVSGNYLIEQVSEALKQDGQTPVHSSRGETIILTKTAHAPTEAPARKIGPVIPRQMPPLPQSFVRRPEHERAVRTILLQDAAQGTLVVSAIYGLGGIGKSVLAAAIAHEKAIQQHFSDGILWITLGQSPDILPMLGRWIFALGDRDFRPTTPEAASSYLRTLLYDKKFLLVVDDVWNPEHLAPFRVGGSDCCVMVTTREAKILDAKRYDLDVFTASQSMALLTQKLTEPLTEADQQKAETFAERVGHLPLAIELAAAQIEDGLTWSELLEDFSSEVARLESLDVLGQEEMSDEAKRRQYSLIASFNLSLRQLTPEQLKQFAWMGVLPEDVSVSQEMAATLWQVRPRQAGTALRQLRSKALILLGAKEEGNRPTYRMHDLMHDTAQRLLKASPQPQRENELPGLGMTKAEAHAALLERYRAKTDRGQWHRLPDDGYIYAYLTWHMEQASCPEMVHQLLQETNALGRNGWYVRCDELVKPSFFVNDVARAWQFAADDFAKDKLTSLNLLWRYTLIRGSINSLSSNIPAELVGALVAKQVWQPAQGLAYAQQAQDPWHRAQCLAELVPHIPKSLLPEMETAIEQINAPAYRVFIMGKLAQHFPDRWPTTLTAISKIQDYYGPDRHRTQGFSYRAQAIADLAEHLPPELLPEALEVTRQIQDQSYRARALGGLAEHLPPELLHEAIALIFAFEDRYYCGKAWSGALPRLEETFPDFSRFHDVLETLAYQPRGQIIGLVPHLIPTVTRLGGEDAIDGYLAVMREVCQQWL